MTGYWPFSRLRWSPALLGAVVMTASMALVLPRPAVASTAATTQVLPPGQVAELTNPGAALTTPADGRLRGSDFTARVTGVAWPTTAGTTTRYVASTGHRLAVFTLSMNGASNFLDELTYGQSATAALDVDGRSLPVDLTSINNQIKTQEGEAPASASQATEVGKATYVASVPANSHRVNLVVGDGSFSQGLDLWTLKRTPPDPSILYRDPDGPTVPATQMPSATIPITDPADGVSSPATVLVTSAKLTAFNPGDPPASSATASNAFLVVTFQSTYPDPSSAPPNSDFSDIEGITPLPGTAITFAAPGRSPVTATAVNPVAPDQQGSVRDDAGLLDATYVFPVPADTTAGTLAVAAGSSTGTEYTDFQGSDPTPIQVGGPTAFALSFPPAPAVPTQKKPPWFGAPLPPTGSAAIEAGSSTQPGSSASGGGFPIWAAIVILVVLVATLVAADRIRRRRHSRSAARPAEVSDPASSPPNPLAAPGHGIVVAGEAGKPQGPRERAPTDNERTDAELTDTDLTDTELADSERAALGADGSLVVSVLVPIEISGWRHQPDGDLPSELCCYLALHPVRPSTLDDIALALWPIDGDRAEPSRASLHSYMSRLRRAVGKDRLSDASGGRGYLLTGVVTDWARFQALDAEADAAETELEACMLRRQALSLVGGIPFSTAPAGQYGWAISEGLVDQMVVAITRCAHRLASSLLALGDVEGARQAATDGLGVSPSEFDLLGDLYRIALTGGDPSEQRRVRARITTALGADDAQRLFTLVEERTHHPTS
jgi:hypothetical protein